MQGKKGKIWGNRRGAFGREKAESFVSRASRKKLENWEGGFGEQKQRKQQEGKENKRRREVLGLS